MGPHPLHSCSILEHPEPTREEQIQTFKQGILPKCFAKTFYPKEKSLIPVFFSSYLALEIDWSSKCKITLNFEILYKNKM